ncbi:putative glycosyltransferase family 28 protein [Trypanosoma cruzi]|uniref:UDP-N-acetylglucosamine transferase subunit ALG14 n=2 Tax=Trypanosoma cruzi TaxID=5693 RepID=Q4D751_TRYCC|nr:glycosyltransferase family 28 protein, putative [Trypanosoma cruzi]EAN88358.1 glycosyltransferase family 28 protein, putative [Trypanosoma cruzi]PWV08545.1 putative glycosyltransferase family 28 protein [Trypanosoma cruzi]|eukprot:XP_810209.1 glycosyltransferase family 28 protein [Trypanosoma cruzi strain CL Brener]
MAFFSLVVLLLSLMVWRFVRVVRGKPSSIHRGRNAPLNVCVVLGSGGHTSEMMRAIRALPLDVWRANRPFYVVSATDSHSAALAAEFEKDQLRRCCRLITIPRAREVGQSYFLSIFTTLQALGSSLLLIVSEKPDVLFVNGPGVCVPVVGAALLVATLSPPWYYRRPGIAYMESYTCVRHISLSGRLLMPFCDVFTVQWQSLYDACLGKWWRRNGSLFFVGVSQDVDDMPLPMAQRQTTSNASGSEQVALVTVGSTQFVSLIKAIDDEAVCQALARRGITRLLVQKGASAYEMRVRNAYSVTVEVFSYRPKLHEIIKDAALVISHAGAGTILETLECKRPLIIVPNRDLMSDHQLELAEALDAARYLFCVQVGSIRQKLQSLDFSTLRVFPGTKLAALREAILPLLAAADFTADDAEE